MIAAAFGLLLATAVHLGPETPVGTRVAGAAASRQSAPAVAWSGQRGLAAWIDERGSYPADRYPSRFKAESMLRVSPMRADGSLVNPEGTALFPAYSARVASNGTSFMLAYNGTDGIHTVPLNENGAPDGIDTHQTEGSRTYDIVANGRTFLLVTTTWPQNNLAAIVLQPSGAASATKTFTTGSYFPVAFALTTIGDTYAIAYLVYPCQQCPTAVHLASMGEDATTTDVQIAQDSGLSTPLLAASEDRLLVSVVGTDGVQSLIAGRDLKVIAPFRTVVSLTGLQGSGPIVWDGQSFLIASLKFIPEEGDIAWQAIRVSPNNVVLDATPAVIARTSPQGALARTSDGIVAVWTEMGDVLRRTFSSNTNLFTQPVTSTATVISPHAQAEASLTESGAQPLRVWREGSLDTHVMLSIDDQTIDVASSTERDLQNPSVVRGGNVILALWRDLPRSWPDQVSVPGYRIYARRFRLDGTPLDPQPLLLDSNDSLWVDLDTGTAAAFDGRNFVAMWSGDAIRVTRIAPTGSVIDSTPFVLSSVSNVAYNTGVRAVSTGSELLVAWSAWDDYRNYREQPRPSPRTAIEIVRLDTRGTSMSVVNAHEVWSDAGISIHADLAWNGTNALLTSVHRGCVQATLFDAKLLTIAENTSVECGSTTWDKQIEHPAVAWDGNEFVAAWAADAVHAMRFDRALQPLDAAPFTVAPAGDSHEPSLAPSASGVEIVYERIDGDVPRLFARELYRSDLLTHRRAAAH